MDPPPKKAVHRNCCVVAQSVKRLFRVSTMYILLLQVTDRAYMGNSSEQFNIKGKITFITLEQLNKPSEDAEKQASSVKRGLGLARSVQ
jgi:hypothetical protein